MYSDEEYEESIRKSAEKTAEMTIGKDNGKLLDIMSALEDY